MKKGKQSIQWRLVGIYVLVIVLVMQAVSIYLIRDIEKMLSDSFELTHRNTAQLLAQKLSGQLQNPEFYRPFLLDELRYQRSELDLETGQKQYNILLFDSEYMMLFGPEEGHYMDDLMLQARSSSTRYASAVRKDSDTGERYLNLVYTINNEAGVEEGGIYIIAGMEDQVFAKVRDIRDIMIFGTGITLIISLILSLALAQTITKPIKELTDSAAEMARGNFDQSIAVYSQDEIGQLGDMFNSMARQLSYTLEEISGEKAKMEAIFTYLSNGVIAFDTAGEVLHINPKAKELLQLENVNSFELLPLLVQKLGIEDLELTVNRPDSFRYELESENRILRVQQAPFKREEQLNGIIMVLEDITEQEALEKMRREFIANASHELKTPLTNIQLRVQALQDFIADTDRTPQQLINEIQAAWNMLGLTEEESCSRLPEGAETLYDLTMPELQELFSKQLNDLEKSILASIEEETQRMSKLVRDLLQLSLLDAEQRRFNFQIIESKDLLAHVIHRMQTAADDKDITLNSDLCSAKIWGDRESLEQVTANIISNAIKYSHEGKSVDITSQIIDNDLVIEIKDCGIGIPKEDLPRIFERFYRVDKARSRGMGGTGLGLAIALEIVEAHGGTIEIESRYRHWTTVRVTLPLAEGVSADGEI